MVLQWLDDSRQWTGEFKSFAESGGFLEYDMELSGAHGGVNNNLYATFPQGGNQGMGSCCDSGGSFSICCAEMDFTEDNGDCLQTTTWHTARDGSGHAGEAHTGSIGNSVLCLRALKRCVARFFVGLNRKASGADFDCIDRVAASMKR